MDLHLEVDPEDEALTGLAVDRAQPLVEVVCDRRGVGPVQGQDRGRHDLRGVDAGVDRVLAGAQRLVPDPPVTGTHDRAELELLTGGVHRRQTDVGLDDAHLALAHDEHRHQLDPDQERVEQVRAVEQRVVLQTDASTVVQEGLVVLVAVVQPVLARQDRLDLLGIRRVGRFESRDVLEAPQPAGDVSGLRRVALESGDDADDVLVGLWRDDRDPQLVGNQAEGRERRFCVAPALRDRYAVHPARGEHEERQRVQRQQRPGGQHRALDALLAALAQEGGQVGEVGESRLVVGALRAHGQRGAELGDDHADLAGRHLYPRVLGHREHRPQLEPEPGHEQTGLVAGLALEGDHLVAAEASPQSLVDQPDLAGSDEPERREDDHQQDPENDRDDERNR